MTKKLGINLLYYLTKDVKKTLVKVKKYQLKRKRIFTVYK